MPRSMLHPYGLIILGASILLALVSWLGFEGRTPGYWVILPGLLAYAASSLVIHRWEAKKGTLQGGETSDDNESGLDVAGFETTIQPVVNIEDFKQAVHRALQVLNNPAILSDVALITMIPRTMEAHLTSPTTGQAGPLDRSQVLREVAVDAIERLRPQEEGISSNSPAMYPFNILYSRFIEGLKAAQIDLANTRIAAPFDGVLDTYGVEVGELNWFGAPPAEGSRVSVQIRYRAVAVRATVAESDPTLRLTFDEPQRAVTPGQSAVIFDGDVVLGGGRIARAVEAVESSDPALSA